MSESTDSNTAVIEAPEPTKARAKPGPKPKATAPIVQNHVAAAEPSRIIRPDAPGTSLIKRVAGTNVVEIGLEGITATQTLGDFETPHEFDKVNLVPAYGCEEAGTVGAFRSVAELCQPQRHPTIRMVHPGWRVWQGSDGNRHTIKKERGTLVLLCADRADNDAINKAYGELSKRQGKSVESSIAATNLVIPADARMSDEREEANLRMSIAAMEAQLT